MSRYAIKEIKTDKTSIPQPQAVKDGILPAHPFRMYIVGSSGSGKTNLLLNLFCRPEFFQGYFESILVCSPTALHLDDSYKELMKCNPEVSESNFYQPSVELLRTLMQIQERRVKNDGIANAPKVCIVFDDVVSFRKFTGSKLFLKYSVMSRHWGISTIILSQAWHRIPKSVRINQSCVVFFKGSARELETVSEVYTSNDIV